MSKEFQHDSVGTSLTQSEWEGEGTHVFDSQATGDLLYASSTSQLKGLAKGAANTLLQMGASIPQWSTSLTLSGTVTIGVDDTGYDVKYFGDTAGRYWLWDTSADGVVQIGTLTIGVNDAGHDVKYFGDTADRYWLWDTSADGVVQRGTLTVGVDDTGHDVKFFGDTASRYWLWDTSADGVVQRGTLTVGVDDTGHDVKFFGATSGKYMLWDESQDDLIIEGQVGISNTDPNASHGYADDLVIGSTSAGNSGMTILTGTGVSGAIYFADATADAARYQGSIEYNHSTELLRFRSGSSVRFEIAGADGLATFKNNVKIDGNTESDGNIGVGGNAAHGSTTGTNLISLFNGTAPAGTLTNGASFFCASGEMKVIDAAGNITVLSPHDDDNQWVFDSRNSVTGKVLHIHMEKLMRRLDEEFGGGFIEEFLEI